MRSYEVNSETMALAWSADGRFLAAGQNNGGIELVDTVRHTKTSLQSEYLPIRALAFSPDGATLLSGEGSGEIRMWHVETGRSLGALISPSTTLTTVTGLFFSSDPDQLIATYYSSDTFPVSVWSLNPD